MKIKHILIALAMVAALSMVSCKNNKKAQNQEPTQEEVQEMKQALADSVLAEIDAILENLFVASEINVFYIGGFELTEAEKLVKPDYLLDLEEANNLVTKSQKINAMAFYVADLGLREIYGMPLEDAKETIAKIGVDLNYPFDIDQYESSVPTSERIKAEYVKCKERGELAFFWQFQYAIIVETSYHLAQNPKLFFSRINEEQWQSYRNKYTAACRAIEELAKYDEEMANLMSFIDTHKATSSKDEFIRSNATIESVIQFRIDNKDKFIAKRNALLQ